MTGFRFCFSRRPLAGGTGSLLSCLISSRLALPKVYFFPCKLNDFENEKYQIHLDGAIGGRPVRNDVVVRQMVVCRGFSRGRTRFRASPAGRFPVGRNRDDKLFLLPLGPLYHRFGGHRHPDAIPWFSLLLEWLCFGRKPSKTEVTTIPTALFAVGIPKVGAGTASMLMTVELPVAVLCAHALLNEPVALWQMVGIALMSGAIIRMNYGKHRQKSSGKEK